MIYKCIIKRNDENDVLISIDNLDLLCFSNSGLYGDIGAEIFVDIDVYDDFDICLSHKKEKAITHISGYQYKITGLLDLEMGGVKSLVFFPLDNLYDYGYLDNKMVDVDIIRLNISNMD